MRVFLNVDKPHGLHIHSFNEPQFETLEVESEDGILVLIFNVGGVGEFARRILALQPPVAKEAANV